jgi:hypothetical protein
MSPLSTIDPESFWELVGLVFAIFLLMVFKILKRGRFTKKPP